jgi:hypothetical protein
MGQDLQEFHLHENQVWQCDARKNRVHPQIWNSGLHHLSGTVVFIATPPWPGASCVSQNGTTPMMVAIKIQCGCGQRYAFDVKTAGDLMPNTVACPVCGADGTAAANAAIAQSLSTPPAVAAAPVGGTRVRVATQPSSGPPATGSRGAVRRAGQIDPTQAQHEAKAKIFWGDPPEAVIGYLLMQGFSHEEASRLVSEMFRERAATVRANGIRKILTGIGLIAVPIVALIVFLSIGVIPMKIFAITIAIGLWGVWLLLNGSIMVLAPKSEKGDLADQ